jgi:hypothetical protein
MDLTPRVSQLLELVYKECKHCNSKAVELPRGAGAVLPRSRQFNRRISMDLLWIPLLLIWVLHMVCSFTRLSGAQVLPGNKRTGPNILNAFNDGWVRSYGYPVEMDLDGEGGLTSKL